VRIFTGHIAPVHTVSISPLGRFAASAGEDKDVILWDLATSKKIAVCKGHTGIVWSTSISRESTILASGSADGTVRLWDMRMLASGDSDGERCALFSVGQHMLPSLSTHHALQREKEPVRSLSNKVYPSLPCWVHPEEFIARGWSIQCSISHYNRRADITIDPPLLYKVNVLRCVK